MVHGFPVIEGEGQLCGLVTRDALESLLLPETMEWVREQRQRGGSRVFSCGASEASGMDGPSGQPSPENAVASTQAGVEWVMDAAPFVVQASTPVLHAHMLFSRCGLRHVVVVDSIHQPIGVLTRKSLMPWRTPWLEQEMLQHDTFVETRDAHSPRGSPQTRPLSSPVLARLSSRESLGRPILQVF